MNTSTLTPKQCQAAYDECKRELQVRERCYARWVKEGKISHTDATTRYQALSHAVELLAEHPAVLNGQISGDEWQPAVTDTNISSLPSPVRMRNAA